MKKKSAEANSLYILENVNVLIKEEGTYLEKLAHYMHKITSHCKGLIHDIFFKDKLIEQIQKQYGYSSKHNAQNQKYKCIEQIKRVKENQEKKSSHRG